MGDMTQPSCALAIPSDAVPALIRGATRSEVMRKLSTATANGSVLTAGPLKADDRGLYVRVLVRPATRPRWRQRFPVKVVALSSAPPLLAWLAVATLGWWLLAAAGVALALSLAARRRSRTVQVHTTTTVTFR